jgi:hypothetical protein
MRGNAEYFGQLKAKNMMQEEVHSQKPDKSLKKSIAVTCCSQLLFNTQSYVSGAAEKSPKTEPHVFE